MMLFVEYKYGNIFNQDCITTEELNLPFLTRT